MLDSKSTKRRLSVEELKERKPEVENKLLATQPGEYAFAKLSFDNLFYLAQIGLVAVYETDLGEFRFALREDKPTMSRNEKVDGLKSGGKE